ncbi:MAG: hypothetical protein LBG13_00685 [Holosporales bacterium]|jgi:hypothetical protein|nr:hypothetical protein [Holosporales bacterium]
MKKLLLIVLACLGITGTCATNAYCIGDYCVGDYSKEEKRVIEEMQQSLIMQTWANLERERIEESIKKKGDFEPLCLEVRKARLMDLIKEVDSQERRYWCGCRPDESSGILDDYFAVGYAGKFNDEIKRETKRILGIDDWWNDKGKVVKKVSLGELWEKVRLAKLMRKIAFEMIFGIPLDRFPRTTPDWNDILYKHKTARWDAWTENVKGVIERHKSARWANGLISSLCE